MTGVSPYSYAIEKLTTAVGCLATHPGDARHRIIAASSVFNVVRASDLPPDLREKWLKVIAEATKFGPILKSNGEVFRSPVENTMNRRKNSTASKLAKAIYEIYWDISCNQRYL
jgi:hypothetical protein